MRINLIKFNPIDSLRPLRLICSFVLLITIYSLALPIFAAADTKVYDYANLLTLEQIDALEVSATEIAETYQVDIGIVTTSDAEGKSSEEYADDFYDYNGYGYTNEYDGLLFLIDMDNRNIYISTCGVAIKYFTDSRIENMLDVIINYMADGDYYSACTNFLDLTKSYLQKGIPSNQYSVDLDSKHEPFTTPTGQPLNSRSIALSSIVAALGAALIAFIVRALVKYSYTHPRYTMPETRPDDLSIHYTERTDHFVTSHTSRVKIQTDTNSGGSSSTHHSSSGRSHGGGGRGF